MGWSKSGQGSCQDAAGPAPAKFLFIFMRAKIVCFRVVCWYFVDATEVSFRGRGACFCCDGRHMQPAGVPWCVVVLRREIFVRLRG